MASKHTTSLCLQYNFIEMYVLCCYWHKTKPVSRTLRKLFCLTADKTSDAPRSECDCSLCFLQIIKTHSCPNDLESKPASVYFWCHPSKSTFLEQIQKTPAVLGLGMRHCRQVMLNNKSGAGNLVLKVEALSPSSSLCQPLAVIRI